MRRKSIFLQGMSFKIIVLISVLTCGFGLSYAATQQEMVSEPEENENEYRGFVIEWEDGNVSDFIRQVENAFDFNFNLDSVSLFGFNSDSSKDTSVDPHTYHRTDLAAADTNKTSLNDANSLKDDHSYKKDSESTETQEDWRENRQWWQRGAPVL